MGKKKAKVKSVLSYLKLINFILKCVGLFPFKIIESKSGPKHFISICGTILTIIHISTFIYCFVNVAQLGKVNIAAKYVKTAISSFDHLIILYSTTVAVFGLFLNILLTLKAQSNMLTLFYRAELLSGNFVFKNVFKVILLCIPHILTFIFGLVTAIVLFLHMLYHHNINGAFYRILVIILPHVYIVSKVTHFIFCVSFVQLGFDHLCQLLIQI